MGPPKIRTVSSFFKRLISWLDYRIARALSRFNVNARIRLLETGNILVLCYGNIYRSPFVEYYLKHITPQALKLNIKSAGFHDKTGRSSADDYVDYCMNWGVDLSTHRSNLVSKELLDWAEIIIIMDGHNYKMLTQNYADVARKIIWLGSVSTKTPTVIADPYDQTSAMQQRVVEQLATASQALISRLASKRA